MNLTGENRGGPRGEGATPQAHPISSVRQAARASYRQVPGTGHANPAGSFLNSGPSEAHEPARLGDEPGREAEALRRSNAQV